MYKYFCGCCGKHFESKIPEKDADGFLSHIPCPYCGAWDIYVDSPEGAAQSCTDQSKYEDALILLDED